MKECCICGKKFGMMSPGVALGPYASLDGLLICADCQSKLQEIRHNRDVEGNAAYFHGFFPAIQNEAIKTYITKVISAPSEANAAKQQRQTEADERRECLKNMLTTSGFNYEGWRITEYLGFISSEVAVGMGFFKAIAASFSDVFGIESEALGDKLLNSKQAAFDRLLGQAYDKGANAIIGIDLDYTMFGDTLVGVIASGTAVKIEKQSF